MRLCLLTEGTGKLGLYSDHAPQESCKSGEVGKPGAGGAIFDPNFCRVK